MARRHRTAYGEAVDAPTDDVIVAESNKIIADSEVATRKAQIMFETDAMIEQANKMTRFKPKRRR